MASDIPADTSANTSADPSSADTEALECGVCLLTFDLADRLPKSLRCGHTLCQGCLTRLACHDSHVRCPTCRQQSVMASDVTTNFALRTILERLCPECLQPKPRVNCPHCERRICASCKTDHVRGYVEGVIARIQGLVGVIKTAQEMSFSTGLREGERRQKENAISEMRRSFRVRRETLDRLEAEMEREIQHHADDNMKKLQQWTRALGARSAEAAGFVHESGDELSDSVEFSEAKEIAEQCEKWTEELAGLTSGPPPVMKYEFQPGTAAESKANVGQIVLTDNQGDQASMDETTTQPEQANGNAQTTPTESAGDGRKPAPGEATSAGKQLDTAEPPADVDPPTEDKATADPSSEETTSASPERPVSPRQDPQDPDQPAIPKEPTKVSPYHRMVFRKMTGTRGSGPNNFDQPKCVVATIDGIFVTDHNNHCIKQLDDDLNFVSAFGGSKRFSFPSGIAVGRKGGELFICDQMNDRIQVTNMTDQLVRTFGSRGSGKAQFDQPMGITAGMNGELFVCEHGNSRVQVVTEKGYYVRMIGAKGSGGVGEFKEYPTRAAVTKNGLLLVVECGSSRLKVFHTAGTFLGFWPLANPDIFQNDCYPIAVCVDPVDGHIIVSYTNNKLGVYDESGNFVCSLGSHGSGPGQFQYVYGLAVTRDRDLVVCDTFNHRVQVWSFR